MNPEYYYPEGKIEETINCLYNRTPEDNQWIYFYGNKIMMPMHWLKDEEIQLLLPMIKIHNPSSVLEIGAGVLYNIWSISKKINAECWATDLSARVLDKARAYAPNIHTRQADNAFLPFEDKRFDVSYSMNTIEQCPKTYKQIIDELIRITKKAVIMFEPSFELGSLYQKYLMWRKGYVRGIPKHRKLTEHYLLPVSKYYNRSACHMIKL